MERILIIDDDNDICLLLAKFLKKKGYETAYVNSGEEGIADLSPGALRLQASG